MVNDLFKFELSAQHLVTLVASIGMTEASAVWGAELTKLHTTLIDGGYMLTRRVKPYQDSNWAMQFWLTLRGEMLLDLWTPEELLIESTQWRTLGIISRQGISEDTITESCLAYVVKRLPLERLPEFLVHQLTRVRWEAETRLKELQNGTLSQV